MARSPNAADTHAALLEQLAASDAEAARLYEEQQRLARIMNDLVGRVKQIWTYEHNEVAESQTNKTFFRLSMDVAWRLQQRRNINLGKLLNLLERKCGERRNTSGVRNNMNWMPYYRDDNVFVDKDEAAAGDGADNDRAIRTNEDPRLGLAPRRIVAHPQPGTPAGGGAGRRMLPPPSSGAAATIGWTVARSCSATYSAWCRPAGLRS